jgi:hypothetical protein
MSKRYVIQVNGNPDLSTDARWVNVQHPNGGDWLTRSSKTALRDAARLYHDGETRELRVAVSQPVYAVTPHAEGTYEHVKMLAQITQDLAAEVAKYGIDDDDDDDDDEADSDYDGQDDDEDEDDEEVAPAQFEIVNEDKA